MRSLPSAALTVLGAVLLMLFIGVAPAEAQTGKLTGVVTDASSGQPLAGAQVFLEGTGRGTLTQENGRFFIINVPPGTYTVTAELIGYATVRRENVQVSIDVTRQVNFELPPEAVAVEEVVVETERTPLIETSATGTSDQISLEEMTSLPVTSVNEMLSLRSGFLDVPQNTDIISLATEQRGLSPVRIRGGRQGETLTLIDGVPVNNFVFGGPAFQLSPYAVRQLDFVRGGFEPQYGNALSGIINVATITGGTELEGGMEYRTTSIAGSLGSDRDDLEGMHLFQGNLTGPVPGTDDKLRFAVAGREERGAQSVYEFDDEAFNPQLLTPEFGFSQPHSLDLWRGWRSFGYDHRRDLFGKLTFLATPSARLHVTGVDYQRQTQPFLADFLLGSGDPVSLCIDVWGDEELCEKSYGSSSFGDIVQGSIELRRQLYSARWDHTVGSRTSYQIVGSVFDQSRETCNFFQGVCLEDRFSNTNFSENFQAPGVTTNHPAAGTGRFFGGEDLTTYMGRFDIQSQLTDHHNVKAGVFYQQHDLDFLEIRDRGTSEVLVVPQKYEAEPFDAAFYFQDNIEFDFMSVRLGFRFDWGEAGGLFFENPLDPTNGTTAFDVCENPGEWQNVDVRLFDQETQTTSIETFSANPNWSRDLCAAERDTLSLAATIARGDDFTTSKTRTQFSPRIGINFPVTATSSLFLNFGVYSQNPLYNNIYQGTGIGTPAEGTPQGTQLFAANFNVPFVGNPNLVIEETTAYEFGYLGELFDNYALQVILFSKDQSGLTGVRTGGVNSQGNQIFDEGVTYGSNTPSYPVLINQDFATVRGLELSIRKRVSDFWGFDLNYSFSRATTNAAPPERQFERLNEGDPQSFTEITSEVDQPHVFNGALRFVARNEAPFDLDVLRYTTLSLVARAASGLPYTPTAPGTQTLGFSPDRRDLNSGRSPSTFQLDLLAQKEFQLGNVRYGAFLQVVNLTDRENCVQVSPASGRCDGGAFDFLRRRTGNPVGESISSTSLDRPWWIGQRRSIRTGLRLAF